MARPIAYLFHTFPQFSTTFLSGEVDEMRRQGERLALFAIQRPAAADFPPAFRRFRDETTYVFPLRPHLFAWRHLACLAARPLAYLGCLAFILTRRALSFKDRRRTLFHFAEAVHLHPEIRRRGCRHVHAHFLFGNAAIALFLHRLFGMTYSLTAHGSDIFVDKVLHAEKLAGARFTRVATEYNAARLRPLLPPARRAEVGVIPFGIDRSEVPPPIPGPDPGPGPGPIPGEKLRILAVGRLIWQKAHHLLLEACASLSRDGIDFHLRLVGDGPLRARLEAQVERLDLRGKVTLAGALPHGEVWSEYRRADLFVLSSVSEGSPFVILEALACGLPVIAPALHGIPEMIEDGRTGKLFQTGSAADLGRAMGEVLGDASLRRRLGKAAASASGGFDQARSVEAFRRSLSGLYLDRNPERLPLSTLKESLT